MPELPEVETTRRGISPFLEQQIITALAIRQPQLRFPVSPELNSLCIGKMICAVRRRGKYLLMDLSEGFILNHLGMSGHLRIVDKNTAPGKHDHLDLTLSNGYILRYNDPRRFGLWLYLPDNPEHHRLLSRLGPEPLTAHFNGAYLFKRSRKKQQTIKSFIMTNEIVVGIGNIYATESLFLAKIHPLTPAGSLSLPDYEQLAQCIKKILQQAIEVGGTTLRDFYTSEGKPGYFANQLLVYGRINQPCSECKTLIRALIIGGRNSAFCPNCQKQGDILGNV